AALRTSRLDSLLLSGPPGEITEYGNVALTRLYASLGNIPRALMAARRRSHMIIWPPYLAAQLREQGRLATGSGDVAGAVTAYQRYLDLRSDPDAELVADVETVRAEVLRLKPSP
ncbi:MAG: tetratricopeptide repeat protein, partial [Gemmatimonadaceae bacterium]